MLAEKSRIILLSGSPLPDSIDWSEGSLENALLPAFVDRPGITPAPDCTAVPPVWRSLDLAVSHLPSGLTQASRDAIQCSSSLEPVAEPESLNRNGGYLVATGRAPSSHGSSISETTAPLSHLSQYYERSFVAHEDIPSSQIVEAASADETSFLSTEAGSFDSESSHHTSQKQRVHAKLCSVYTSHLSEIPTAVSLNSIVPQTMTVNLVVGIISISQPRTIMTRKGGRTMELVELLVGDSTQAGFGINIWIPPTPAQKVDAPRMNTSDYLRGEVLLRLRPRDIIFARRLALGSFRGKVYGQSLRRGMTTLDLLYRDAVDAEDARGAFNVQDINASVEGSNEIAQVKRVRDWMMEFVGAGSITATSKPKTLPNICSEGVNLPFLPPDTQ